MSIDFSTLQGLTIPEGVATQIADAAGNVLWTSWRTSGNVILEVKKIISNTYAGSTTYSNEAFILLDVYPKSGGTVSVTYGGLTKTITDDGTSEEPNAQQVFFGTFNGVSDDEETPSSGRLTIEGDCYAFACGNFSMSKLSTYKCNAVQTIVNFGAVARIPAVAFGSSDGLSLCCINIETAIIPDGVVSIGNLAFAGCSELTKVTIPASVQNIGNNPWAGGGLFAAETYKNIITVKDGNEAYKIDSNCLVEIASKRLVSGFEDSIIPSYIQSIGDYAFWGRGDTLENIVIPSSVISIGCDALNCGKLTSITFENPDGWYVTKTTGGDASTGTAVDLSDPANNATLFTSTYTGSNYRWYRS